jgi:hypothetical protein
MGKLSKQLKRLRGRIELGKLRYPPWRRRVLTLLIVFPFVLGAVLALTVGFVIALAGFGAAFSLPAFFRHDLIPGPRLSAAIVTKEGHFEDVGLPSPKLRSIDGDAIIRAGQKAARETAPEIKPEEDTFYRITIPGPRSPFEPTADDRREFTADVMGYAQALEEWLERYVAVRLESARRCRISFRIENDGEAPAQNVRLRVHCPPGFQHLTKPLPVEEAPEQPVYRNPFDRTPPVMERSSFLRKVSQRLMAEPASGPVATVSHEEDHLVLTYEIGHLNHGPDHMRTEPITLLAPEAGSFQFRWEALSANPGPAANGHLRVELNPSVEIEPAIKTMNGIAEDEERHGIEETDEPPRQLSQSLAA